MTSKSLLLFSSLAVGAALSGAPCARAESLYGRFLVGSYVSSESYPVSLDGQSRNDFATASTRLFLRYSEVGTQRLDYTLDLRDKHDFFDKLDRELLALSSRNTPQLRQLSVRSPGENRLFWSVGRFAVTEAGAAYTDGAELGYRLTPAWRLAAFGGLNPKRPEQTYLQLNRDALTGGLYARYQPDAPWGRYVYLTSALVTQTVNGTADRTYLYGNLVYQWSAPSQVAAFVYVDLLPEDHIQNAFVSYLQRISDAVTTTLSYSAIDAIQYGQSQSVLETLPPSRYREGSANVRLALAPAVSLDTSFLYGVRQSDSLHRREFSIGPRFARLFSPHFSAQALAGTRRNFTADDTFLKYQLGYYSRDWELTFDEERAVRRDSDGLVYHPTVRELGLAHFFSKGLYGTVSYQRAGMETVTINSFFFKLSYRFGKDAVAPPRDGSPPRGRL